MNWQQQKIVGFTGINNSINAKKDEFEILRNLVTDIYPNEISLISGYGMFKDFSKENFTVEYFLFLDVSKRYLITIDTNGNVRADSSMVGLIEGYSKGNFTYHKVNDSVRFSNGVASWFLGEIDGKIYFEKQFNYSSSISFEIGSSASQLLGNKFSRKLLKGVYKYLLVVRVDKYQYLMINSKKLQLDKDSYLKITANIEFIKGYGRVDKIMVFEKNDLSNYNLIIELNVKDYNSKEGNIYSYSDQFMNIIPSDISSSTVSNLSTPEKYIKEINKGNNIYVKEGYLPYISGNGSGIYTDAFLPDTDYNQRIVFGNMNNYEIRYKALIPIIDTMNHNIYLNSYSQIKIKIPYSFKKGVNYKVSLKVQCIIPKFIKVNYAGISEVNGYYYVIKNDLTFDCDNSSSFLADGTKKTLNVTLTSDQESILFTSEFNSALSNVESEIRKSLELSKGNVFSAGYLIIESVSVEQSDGYSVSSVVGYQIDETTNYVTGWGKALLIDNKTHYIKPVLKDDLTFKKNRIIRSLINQHDIATGSDFLSVEEFDGEEIISAEVLPQQRDIIAFKNNVIKVINSAGYIYELSRTKGIANKNALCRKGDSICFATKEGIFTAGGQKIEELSTGIRELFSKFNKEKIVMSTDLKGRLHVADGVNEELILTETGWTMYAQINTYYLNDELLYLLSNNNILCSGFDKVLTTEFLTSSFETFKIGEFNSYSKVILNSVWIYGKYEATTNPILLVKTDKKILELELPINLSGEFVRKIIPVENAKKIQIGLKGSFKNIKISSAGFNWKPMITI